MSYNIFHKSICNFYCALWICARFLLTGKASIHHFLKALTDLDFPELFVETLKKTAVWGIATFLYNFDFAFWTISCLVRSKYLAYISTTGVLFRVHNKDYASGDWMYWKSNKLRYKIMQGQIFPSLLINFINALRIIIVLPL